MKKYVCLSVIRISLTALITAGLTVPASAQAPWQDNVDVGDVGLAGSVTITEDGTIVSGAGDDIWDTADAFHYLFSDNGSGDSINARATVTSIDGTRPWTKVGLMLRHDLTPGSAHHFVFATRSMGIAYQRRLTNKGHTLHTTLDASSALPVTFELMRRPGNYTVINVLHNGAWEQVAVLPANGHALVGLAVTSHDRAVLATGTFTDVTIDTDPDPQVTIASPGPGQEAVAGTPLTIEWTQQPAGAATVSYSVDNGQSWAVVPGCASITSTTCVWDNPGPETEAARVRVAVDDPNERTAWSVSFPFVIRSSTPTMLPPGWTSGDIGEVGLTGSAAYARESGQFTIAGSGADIWSTSDEFQFVSRTIVDDPDFGVEITARVASVESVHQWTKAGLMLRAHRGPGAAHVSAFVTPSTLKGVAFQRRPAEGALSVHTTGPAITAPVWLKFIAGAGQVRAYYRQAATDPWTFLGQDTITLSGPYEVGLAVSSHRDDRLARATFDNVTIVGRGAFTDTDIGAVRVPGATATNDIEVTLRGSGTDIWGTADAFRYRYGAMSSTGAISAAVRSIQRTDPWAKAGVMIRSDLSPGSPHVMLMVSATRGIAMQYRAEPNGASANVVAIPGAAPEWVRLRRQGLTIVGEISDDGVTWQAFGNIDLPLGDSVTAGLVVTSHNNPRLATGVFEDVVLLD